jgi:GNAT superfamily N-acetyltransferase
MQEWQCRDLTAADRGQWWELWRAYLDFYGATIAPNVPDLTWARLTDPHTPLRARAVFDEENMVGLTHFIFHLSAWTEGPYCYLQDLYTLPAYRGRGVGTALIGSVKECASEEGAARVYWLTHKDNEVARRVYQRVAKDSGFIQYRMDVTSK